MNFDLMLSDRIQKIQSINEQYNLLDNAYLSFSGGKDSVVLSHLVDLALPNNKIPRLFLNTGIEYIDMVKFVKEIAEKDDRFIVYNNKTNITNMLKEFGYPFKSKQHSHNISIFQNNKENCQNYIEIIEKNPQLKKDYDFIHNLPLGIKTIIKYYFGVREKDGKLYFNSKHSCPNILKYQFKNGCKLKMSDECCSKLKKENAHQWQKENNKSIVLTGIRAEEGGMRNQGGCAVFDGDKLVKFHPLKVVNEDFEKWFIEKYNIKLCKLYYPPYNFKRTGCKGCPFALDLNNQLEIMKEYLPSENKQCELIWKPVYDEYRRLNYHLSNNYSIFD